jgi:uncharacterized protein YdaU (DUF1376 family)
MQRMTWVKWYMTDYMVSVRKMSWAARGIYMDALALQFHGERLDAGYEAWQDMFPGITEKDYDQIVSHFEMRKDSKGSHFVNLRLESEMAAVMDRSQKASANAKRKHSVRSASAQRPHSETPAIRGEERREEKNREESTNSTNPQDDGCSAPRKARAKPRDTIGWSLEHGWSGITDRDREDWAVAYPLVNIDQDLAKAHQHLLANPAKQAKRLWRKFLTNWFNRTQEGGGSRAAGASTERRGPPTGHIPPDAHPDEHYKWYMTNGWTPRQIPIYRTVDGRERWLNGDYIDEETSQEHADENDE